VTVVALVSAVAGTFMLPGSGATASSLVPGGTGVRPAARVVRLSAPRTGTSLPGFVLKSVTARRTAKPAYSGDIVYPRVTGVSKSAASRINARIVSYVDGTATSFKHEVLRTAHIQLPPGSGPSALIGSVNTEFDSGRIVTVSLSEYTYFAGAAHGITTDTTLNFDAVTGSRYRLADLFTPSAKWLVALSGASRRALPRLVGSLSNTEWIDSGTVPRPANFAVWSLTPWGLQITFGDYQVAAYAAGMPLVVIPYAQLAKLARPGGPIALAAGEAAAATAGPLRMPLLPEISEPATGECHSPVSFLQGLPGPLRCSDGRINVTTWDIYTQFVDGDGSGGLRVLTLGTRPSVATVRAVMCADLGSGPYQDRGGELQAEHLAAIYHGWRFPVSPTVGFPGYCHRAK
jgi:hypothetical protein